MTDTDSIRPISRESEDEMPADPPALLWLREFPGEPRQVRESRHWLAEILPDCDARSILVQIASELVTNAVQHTRSGNRGGTFGVHVAWSASTVRVAVGDQGSLEVPTVLEAVPEQESMRGLYLVRSIAAAWDSAGNSRGRWVWADVLWGKQGGPRRIASRGALPTVEAVRRLLLVYPGIQVGYDGEPAQWWAKDSGTGRIRAPCFGALNQLVAATRLSSR